MNLNSSSGKRRKALPTSNPHDRTIELLRSSIHCIQMRLLSDFANDSLTIDLREELEGQLDSLQRELHIREMLAAEGYA